MCVYLQVPLFLCICVLTSQYFYAKHCVTIWLVFMTHTFLINQFLYVRHLCFYPPWKRGDIGLSLSVCLSVCLSVPLEIGYFVHASWIWRSWARPFKFYTRMNQGLKSCLVKVSSRSVENCRFWCTLKSSEKFMFKWGNAGDNIRYYHLSTWYVLI